MHMGMILYLLSITSTRDEVRLSLQPILHFSIFHTDKSTVISNPVALYTTRLEGTVAIS